jgi:signal recognition particle GTPase
MAALQAWSFSRSKNEVKSKTGSLISIHDAILQEVLKADANYIPTYNTIMINGITGAGKSSAVSAIVNLLNSDKLTYVTAANETQRAKYYDHLKKRHPQAELLQTGSITDLMGKFLTKDGKAALVS